MYTIETLSKTIEDVSHSFGKNFFDKMTASLAQAVSADVCLIARIDENFIQSKTISVYSLGQHIKNFQYDLKGTPCEVVACGGLSIYHENVSSQFPDDLLLTKMNIEAYVGTYLKDARGKVLGIVVALFKKKLNESESIKKLYTLFSSRIALEMDRLDKTRLLEESNKRLEDRVQQRTLELEQANIEVRRFVYIVSHDLRTPIVNIKGFSAELKCSIQDIRNVLSSDSEDKASQLEALIEQDLPESMAFIETSANKMDSQINAILKLSHLGNRTLIPECIDMNELIQEQVTLLQHQLEKKQVELIVENLHSLTADRYSMEQIFNDLLDNALKFLKPNQKGLLRILSEEKIVSVGKNIIFHVTDNGRGIDEKEQNIVFDVFKRVGEQNTVGEGMGLTYIKTLVQRHGGKIWCSSEQGEGSTFSFSMMSKDNKNDNE